MNFTKWLESTKSFFDEEFIYFSLSLEEKAQFLENKKRYRLARRKYMELKNFSKVIEISHVLRDYQTIFDYQVKVNQIDHAIQTAELYELYPSGARLCEKQGYLIKAAYMYCHFDLIKAASLFKQAYLWEKAADCYIKAKQYIRAVDCYDQITNPDEKKNGYDQIKKFADELCDLQQYESAIKLYVRIHELKNALQAAEQLQDEKMQYLLYEQLGQQAISDKNLELAASYYENVDLSQAFALYMQSKNIEKASFILLKQHKFEEAIHLYLKYDQTDNALQIAVQQHLLPLLIPYYKEKNNDDKLVWIYEQIDDPISAINYFQCQNNIEKVIYFAKKLPQVIQTAEILEQLEQYEQSAHYYLLDGNEKSCMECLKKAGKTPTEIETYLRVKNYPN